MPIYYRKKYIQTYFWQAVSILLGFASLFIVVPYLSSNKVLYGIYSVCTSLTIFFSYADLGFLSAGVKYAAEYYIRGEREQEMKVIGFTAFIMLSVFSVLALVMVYLGFNPNIVIPELEPGTDNYYIARALLLTLAISCPAIIAQRILSIVFTIRVEDYIYQRFNIVGNICRILSVFYFFGDGSYRVVEYYIFYQMVSLAVVISALIYTRRYGYNIFEFVKSIHFDKSIFDKVKAISGTSLIMTISMILYYELDQVFISNLLGIEAVAIYGAAISVLTLVRQFSSVVYSPYTSRYNHYAGLKDYNGLSNFVRTMVYTFTPVIVLPIVAVSLFASPFINSWIGPEYADSAILVSFLVLCFTPNCLKDPISAYFVAMERNRTLIKYNVISPIIYWLGIIATIKLWGLSSFAVFKTVAPMIVTIGFWKLINNEFREKGFEPLSLPRFLKTLFIPIIVLVIFRFSTESLVSYDHTKIGLFQNFAVIGFGVVVSMIVAIFCNNTLRGLVQSYLGSILSKLKKR